MAGKLRAFLVWGLFVIWVTWLAWQSYFYGRFPVVSRAQMLMADVVVLADMTEANQTRVEVEKVIWPQDAKLNFESKSVNLGVSRVDGFVGAGKYAIPLSSTGSQYHLAEIPRSPLAEHGQSKHYVYPATPAVLDQLRRFPAPPRLPTAR